MWNGGCLMIGLAVVAAALLFPQMPEPALFVFLFMAAFIGMEWKGK